LLLKRWLETERDIIVRRWVSEVRTLLGRPAELSDGLLSTFLLHLVRLLPHCLGERKDQALEVWQQAAHLYGSVGLRRGLAAGEVVEEVSLLRECILRLLLDGGSGRWEDKAFHRDLLALNRCLDRAVVAASVAYVDDLFFAHLQGSGVPEGVTEELEEETRAQLESFLRELDPGRTQEN
jgi:hypothetical protein